MEREKKEGHEMRGGCRERNGEREKKAMRGGRGGEKWREKRRHEVEERKKWKEQKARRWGGEKEIHCKKELAIFPSPAGMSLTKLSLGGKKLNYSRPGRV